MTNSDTDAARSGYDLVRRMLDHPNGDVEALFELAARAETEWLEFKAATGDAKPQNGNSK